MNARSLPAIDSPDPYMVEMIDDEMEIAQLLGYLKLERPYSGGDKPTIWGVRGDFKPGWPGAQGRAFLPQWRRTNDCFELIALCNLCVMVCDDRVVCGAGAGKRFTAQAEVSAHPSKDAAIRHAMCKAAIAYLQDEQSKNRAA